MRFFISCDCDWETKVDAVVYQISAHAEHFEHAAYWGGLNGIAIVLMCRDPSLAFRKRVRYSKRESVIYMDVMLDYQEMLNSSESDRKRVVLRELGEDVPNVIGKYRIEGFDADAFLADFRSWLSRLA